MCRAFPEQRQATIHLPLFIIQYSSVLTPAIEYAALARSESTPCVLILPITHTGAYMLANGTGGSIVGIWRGDDGWLDSPALGGMMLPPEQHD